MPLQNCKEWLLALSYLSVRLSVCVSVCVENSAPTARIFMRIFRKPVEDIQVLLKSDKNTGHFRPPWTPSYIYDNVSLTPS